MSEEQPGYPPTPAPGHRFVEDVGYGFTAGMAGSSFFSPFGGLRRGGLAGAARAVSARAPRTAGTLAAYFGLVSALETAMDVARPNEDLWNCVAASVVSWAALGVRRGAAGAAVAAVGLGVVFLDERLPRRQTPRHRPAQPLHAPATPAGFVGIPEGPPIVAEEVSAVGDQRL